MAVTTDKRRLTMSRMKALVFGTLFTSVDGLIRVCGG
jgi:hypothetical protein